MRAALAALRFDNRAVAALPVDRSGDTRVRQVPGAIFAAVRPTPLREPELVAASAPALALVGLPPPACDDDEAALAEAFSGNHLPGGADPVAHCYCGHQFGHFAGQLGDGAAILLGEVGGVELQLKGAGLTQFSRTADGRKVLRSSLREFVASEYVHALGIPTTRAGTLVVSGGERADRVLRDPLYDGTAMMEKCAVVLRLCPTFVRFGSFQIGLVDGGRRGPSAGEGSVALLRGLAAHSIRVSFTPAATAAWAASLPLIPPPPPGALPPGGGAVDDPGVGEGDVAGLVVAAAARTGRVVAAWEGVGFVHGVLNTDNIGIAAHTIDYGPYGFVEAYNPSFVPNGSDHGGRYALGRQAEVCRWNCEQLGRACEPLLPPTAPANPPLPERAAAAFDAAHAAARSALFARKLGLAAGAAADALAEELRGVLHWCAADWTTAWRSLAGVASGAVSPTEWARAVPCLPPIQVAQCAARRGPAADRLPPREVLRALLDTPGLMEARLPAEQLPQARAELLDLLAQHDAADARAAAVAAARSGEDAGVAAERVARLSAWAEKYAAAGPSAAGMDAANPAFQLRNWVVQEAVAAAERGDYAPTRALLSRASRPYEADPTDPQGVGVFGPAGAQMVVVTCSS